MALITVKALYLAKMPPNKMSNNSIFLKTHLFKLLFLLHSALGSIDESL